MRRKSEDFCQVSRVSQASQQGLSVWLQGNLHLNQAKIAAESRIMTLTNGIFASLSGTETSLSGTDLSQFGIAPDLMGEK